MIVYLPFATSAVEKMDALLQTLSFLIEKYVCACEKTNNDHLSMASGVSSCPDREEA
jgi:hypothetical protein